MRASSLSNARVVELLNAYCVPVHLSNGDRKAAADQSEKERIYRDALAAGLHAGSVCAYLVAPDGRPLACAPLNKDLATDPARFEGSLRSLALEQGIKPGPTLVAPSKDQESSRDRDALAVHIVTRYVERRGDLEAPLDTQKVLGTDAAGNWGDLPSESWVRLDRADWRKLLPVGPVDVGADWTVDAAVLEKILTHFYPPTENTNSAKNRFDALRVTGHVEGIENGIITARLMGQLRMKHPFYHDDDDNVVDARLVGYLDFDARGERRPTLRLVTHEATYGGSVNGVQPFGAAARSTP